VCLADGLGFAEGPLVRPDGGIVFCDGSRDRLLEYRGGQVSDHARLGGPPNATALGSDGSIYVTQVGGSDRSLPAIERVRADGRIEPVATGVAGLELIAPNDLAFGPDGRLYFTDSGADYDPSVPATVGRVFALGTDGGLVLDLGGVYPNGIAFDAQARLLWTESYPRRLCRLEPAGPRVLHAFARDHVPDGMAIAADGRIFVATLSSSGVTVLSPDGERLGHLGLPAWPTNCAFSGEDLIVTAIGNVPGEDETGSLWSIPVGVEGLPLHAGRIS
jgi:gluconolactonase